MTPYAINIKVRVQPSQPLWRVLHDQETWYTSLKDKRIPGGWKHWLWRGGGNGGVPEVFNFVDGHPTVFSEPWQRLTYALNRGGQPNSMNGAGFRDTFGTTIAFCNGSGFASRKGTDDKNDYINNKLNGRDPFFDTSRVCGGATISGQEVTVTKKNLNDARETFHALKVETLRYDPDKPNDGAPSLEWLLARPWLYFAAVNVAKLGDGPYQSKLTREVVSDFPQSPNPVLIPLVTTKQVYYPMTWLQPMNEMADRYKIYLA